MPHSAHTRKRSIQDSDCGTERPEKKSKLNPPARKQLAVTCESECEHSQINLKSTPTIEHLAAYHLPEILGGEVYYVAEVSIKLFVFIYALHSPLKFVSEKTAGQWYAALEKECPCMSMYFMLLSFSHFLERVPSSLEGLWEECLPKPINYR